MRVYLSPRRASSRVLVVIFLSCASIYLVLRANLPALTHPNLAGAGFTKPRTLLKLDFLTSARNKCIAFVRKSSFSEARGLRETGARSAVDLLVTRSMFHVAAFGQLSPYEYECDTSRAPTRSQPASSKTFHADIARYQMRVRYRSISNQFNIECALPVLSIVHARRCMLAFLTVPVHRHFFTETFCIKNKSSTTKCSCVLHEVTGQQSLRDLVERDVFVCA